MAETFLGFYQFRLFSGMTQADLYEIAHMTRRLKVKKHESVYQSGNQAAFMYLLMDGRVKVFRTNADGREVILNSLRSGEVFGEECVLGEDSYGSTVEATQDSLIGAITTVDIGHYLSSHTHLALEFARLLTARLRKTQQLVRTSSASTCRAGSHASCSHTTRRLEALIGFPVVRDSPIRRWRIISAAAEKR